MRGRARETLRSSLRTLSVSEGPNHKAAASQGGHSLTVAVPKENPEEPWLLPADSVTDPASAGPGFREPGGSSARGPAGPPTYCGIPVFCTCSACKTAGQALFAVLFALPSPRLTEPTTPDCTVNRIWAKRARPQHAKHVLFFRHCPAALADVPHAVFVRELEDMP